MDWTEPVLLQHEYRIGRSRRRILARLGFPRPVEGGREWACVFQLADSKGGKIRTAHGVDGLQALLIAATAIRKFLDKKKNVNSNDEPYEFVFPRVVPTAYGLAFHQHLCNLLDEKINTKERQLSRKRLSRKRTPEK